MAIKFTPASAEELAARGVVVEQPAVEQPVAEEANVVEEAKPEAKAKPKGGKK